MKDDLREAVAGAIWDSVPGRISWEQVQDEATPDKSIVSAMLAFDVAKTFAAADAAIAAARPVIGEECAKVAEDDRHLWGAAGGVGNAVLLTEPRVIAAAIRSATR